MSRGQELAGGQPHHGEEGQQVGLQLHHRHPVAGISQPDAGVVAHLTHIPHIKCPNLADPESAVLELLLTQDSHVYGTRTYVFYSSQTVNEDFAEVS